MVGMTATAIPSRRTDPRSIRAVLRAAVRPAPEVPRWAVVCAHLVPLLVLPSGIWRLVLGAGVPVGFTGDLAELYAAPGWITPYVVLLTLASELAAMTSFALVARWGEVVPAWVPRLRGRILPRTLVAGVAAAGTVVLTLVAVPTVALWNGPENMGDPDAPQGLAGLVMTACYAPMLAWPPLLAALTVAYWRRRAPLPRGTREPAGVST